MDIGRAVKSRRGFLCMRQDELAKSANIGATFISLVESGKRTPSVVVLERIATALKINLWELVRNAEEYRGPQ